jgi:hypothetical protein
VKALEAFVILGLVLLLLVAQFSAYASILRVPSRDWRLIGRTKGALLALVFFSGGIGGLYYWAVIRRELRPA